MNINILQLAEIIFAESKHITDSAAVISHVSNDSRTLQNPENTVFFAFSGTNNNGHHFIPEVFKGGVRNFVVEDAEYLSGADEKLLASCNFLLVSKSIDALQLLAGFHRKQFHNPLIGITGSNGKTIVKEWLYQLLFRDMAVYRSPKSYNSQLGVPFSLLGLEPSYDLAIIEAGISKTGEMEKLAAMINPDIGIFTNIGPAHQEGFASLQQKIDEKLRLFKKSRVIILCSDYQLIAKQVERRALEGFFENEPVFLTWTVHENADLKVIERRREGKDTVILAEYGGRRMQASIPFIDDASFENIMHCWLLLLHLGYHDDFINNGLRNLSPVEMRLELKEGINGCTIVNDSYNSDLNSLKIALDFLNQQIQHQDRTIILSDILQSGKPLNELYTEVNSILKDKGVQKLIGIGPEISVNFKAFSVPSTFYYDTESFLKNFDPSSVSGQAILIKGARKFSFEKISQWLQKKSHHTILEINLNNLIHNLSIYRVYLKPETKVMAMVKAFSYGSGSYEIAAALQYHKVDYLAVAYADEGVDLRNAGISLPIMVMNPEKSSFELLLANNLEPEIYSISMLRDYIAFCREFADSSREHAIHIKLDTGMHRLGFVENEAQKLTEILCEVPCVRVKSVFTHLAASAESGHDDFTKQQIEAFTNISNIIETSLGYSFYRHVLNSTGVLRFPEAQFDMVRLGIGLYGIDETGMISDKLKNVNTLKTVISQIKSIKAGETVGYSRSGIALKDSEIATIGIGYADGFLRALGNGRGSVLIGGREAPTIGNICMDMAMIDVTGLDVNEGDEVIVFGDNLPVSVVAQKLGTIPYEVLTNISQRVKRVYFKD